MDTRKKMLERVKALLAKTMANGCTEGEAMAALDKARELMAAYEIEESDLIPDDEKARIHPTGYDDPYGIKKKIAYAVQKFTRCRGWVSSRTGVTFCGLDSDVEFAAWLIDTLSQFVQRELKAFRAAEKRKGRPTPRIVSSSFAFGAAQRISARLMALSPAEQLGRGLVISRNALIDAAMNEAGIEVSKGRAYRPRVLGNAYAAGQSAGDRASFGRPVQSGGALRLGR